MQLEWRKQGVGFYAVNGSVAAKGPSTGGVGWVLETRRPRKCPYYGPQGSLHATGSGRACGESSLISLLSQLPPAVVTGQVLRELKQIATNGEGLSRPWRARAKSDLQLGVSPHPAAVPSTCPGALALSGVLRRLQQVEEKIVQVNLLLCFCWDAFLLSPFPSAWGWGPSSSCLLSCTFLITQHYFSVDETSVSIMLSFSFLTLLSLLDYRRGLRAWPTGNFTPRTLRRRQLTWPPCLDMGMCLR